MFLNRPAQRVEFTPGVDTMLILPGFDYARRAEVTVAD